MFDPFYSYSTKIVLIGLEILIAVILFCIIMVEVGIKAFALEKMACLMAFVYLIIVPT